MGAFAFRYQTSSPPTGGGSFSITAPNIGNVYTTLDGYRFVACYGDWVYVIGNWNNLGSYPGSGFTWSSTAGWTPVGRGPSQAGPLGMNALAVQLGGAFPPINLTAGGPGTGDCSASAWIIMDNRPIVTATVIVGGTPVPTQVHQYLLEGQSFISNSGATYLMPPLGPLHTPTQWSYILLNGNGNLANPAIMQGWDAGWRISTDPSFPNAASYDIPNRDDPSFSPALLTVGANMSGVAVCFSDDYFSLGAGGSYYTNWLTDPLKLRPDPIGQQIAADQGGGIHVM